MESDNILQIIPELWQSRILNDSKRFNEPEKIVLSLTLGYGKTTNVHDTLINIAKAEAELVQGQWNGDEYLKELYFLEKDRPRVEKELRNGARRLFSFLSDFSSESQIASVEQIFDRMPITKANNLEELKGSLFGMIQFPRRYIKGLEMACAFASKEYPLYGYPWTSVEFEKTLEAYLQERTNHTGNRIINQTILRKLILPGCYGAGKRK